MAVPSTIADLSITAASNSPSGADSVTSNTGPDEYFRAISAIVRREQAQATATASATTVDLGAIATGNYVHITGTTTITGFGTVAAGIERTVVFDGALTLTHNATSLILPGGANITTAAGDVAVFRSEGAGNWRCVGYQTAAGYAKLNAEQTWTAQQVPFSGSATATTEADWDCDTTGQVYDLTTGAANFAMNAPTNVNNRACYVLRVTQGATARVITWNAAYKFPGGLNPVLTASANAIDIFTFVGGASNVMHCIGVLKGLS